MFWQFWADALPCCADLLLAELGDLLLHHGDLSVHSVHVLDQLLLWKASWHQIQIRIHVDWTHWGDGLQFANGASTILQKRIRKSSFKITGISVSHFTVKTQNYEEESCVSRPQDVWMKFKSIFSSQYIPYQVLMITTTSVTTIIMIVITIIDYLKAPFRKPKDAVQESWEQ